MVSPLVTPSGGGEIGVTTCPFRLDAEARESAGEIARASSSLFSGAMKILDPFPEEEGEFRGRVG